MHTLYVGIDVGHESHTAALLGLQHLTADAWRKVKPLAVRNTRADFTKLIDAIAAQEPDPQRVALAMDHTGGHYSAPLLHFLTAQGYRVAFLEPKAVSEARKKLLAFENKSDHFDGHALARLLWLRDQAGEELRIPEIHPVLGSAAGLMRSLIGQRWGYQRLRNQSVNRLHQLLAAIFPEGEARYFPQLLKVLHEAPTPQEMAALTSERWKALRVAPRSATAIMNLARDTVGVPPKFNSVDYRTAIIRLAEHLHHLDTLTAELEAQIPDLVQAHPYHKILCTFPGMSLWAEATLIGVIGQVARFRSVWAFKRVLGVYPVVKQSGGRKLTMMGREGSKDSRRVLFQVALTIVSPRAPANQFRAYHLRLKTRGKKPIQALVATMGKVCEVMYACLTKGEAFKLKQEDHHEPTRSAPSLSPARPGPPVGGLDGPSKPSDVRGR